MLDPIASIKLSPRTSQFGIVKAVEDLLLSPGFPREMETGPSERERSVATIFVVQALFYHAGIKGDPWSKNFPSRSDVAKACLHARVEVVLAE